VKAASGSHFWPPNLTFESDSSRSLWTDNGSGAPFERARRGVAVTKLATKSAQIRRRRSHHKRLHLVSGTKGKAIRRAETSSHKTDATPVHTRTETNIHRRIARSVD